MHTPMMEAADYPHRKEQLLDVYKIQLFDYIEAATFLQLNLNSLCRKFFPQRLFNHLNQEKNRAGDEMCIRDRSRPDRPHTFLLCDLTLLLF